MNREKRHAPAALRTAPILDVRGAERAATLHVALALRAAHTLARAFDGAMWFDAWARMLDVLARTLAEDVLAELAEGLPPRLAAEVDAIVAVPANDLDAREVLSEFARLGEGLDAARRYLAHALRNDVPCLDGHLAWCRARIDRAALDLPFLMVVDRLEAAGVTPHVPAELAVPEAPCAT